MVSSPKLSNPQRDAGKIWKVLKPRVKQKGRIRFGSDCAGLMGATLAMEALGFNDMDMMHTFISEKSKAVKRIIIENYNIDPDDIVDDLMKRDDTTAPVCDIYTCGFPCQPFSTAGTRQGQQDKLGRGKLAMKICSYIREKQPKGFVLENVKGIGASRFSKFRARFMKALNAIETANGKQVYKIYQGVLNSKDHGVAQNRARYYVVGIKKTLLANTGIEFEFPHPLPTPPLNCFLMKNVKQTLQPPDIQAIKATTTKICFS